jgi:hypothetical protein
MKTRRRRPLTVVLGGLAAAAVFVGAGRLAAGPGVPGEPVPFVGPAGTAAAAERFLAAWERNLTTSWSVEESIDRVTAAGRSLTYSVHRAQRPPDQVQIGLGSIGGRLGDRQVGCAPDEAGHVSCRTSPTTKTYPAQVAGLMADLRPYVLGGNPLYAVAEVAGCFQLTLRLPTFPAPPYGRIAVFCFDPRSGAPAGSVVVRDQATDRTTVLSAHAPATDEDLKLPSQVSGVAPA